MNSNEYHLTFIALDKTYKQTYVDWPIHSRNAINSD